MIENIKKYIDKKQVTKIILLFAVVIVIMGTFEGIAYADGLLDSGSNNQFSEIKDGWGQFISYAYRNNYNLDGGDLGFLDVIDKGLNAISNFIFSGMLIISWLGVSIFNFCFNNNITSKFSEVIESLSTSLKNGVFDKFFMLMFVISLISLLIYFVKRNYAAAVNHIIIVALLSIMAVTFSSSSANKFVMQTLNISNDIGMTLVSSLSGEENSEIAVNNMIGTLWGNLVHKPWVILEYDGKVSVEDHNKNEAIEKSKKMLSKSKNSDERKELAKDEIKDVSMTSRLASTTILFLINIVKVGILMILGVMQVFLQILSNLMILIAPLILLLAIVPFFGGLNMLKWLGQKYLGIQLNIILLSFGIGTLIVIDKVILEFFIGIGASFTVALLIQCICWILLIVFRKQVVLSFNKIQRKLNGTMSAGKLMNKMLDKEVEAGKWAKEKVGTVSKKATQPIKNQAVNLKDTAERKIKYASKYATGKAKLATAKTTAGIIDSVALKLENLKRRDIEDTNVESNEIRDEVNIKDKTSNPKCDIKDKLNDVRKSNIESINFIGIKNNDVERVNREDTSKIDSINGLHKNNDTKKSNGLDDIKEKVKDKKVEAIETTNIKDNNVEGVNREDISKIESINGVYKNNDTKKSNGLDDIKEKVKDKNDEVIEITHMKDIEKGIKNNSKSKDEANVISFNQARVKRGREEVDSEQLKNNLRKDLQKEYRDEKRLKSEELQKLKQKSRAEALKNKLGVSSKQIKAKERTLKKELKQISSKNINKSKK